MVTARRDGKGGEPHGVVEVGYDDEGWGAFRGNAVIVLTLVQGEQEVLLVSDVTLVNGDTTAWEFAPVPLWSWQDVEHASVEFVPAE